jgi:proton-coupled amino acid transporter
MMLKGFLVTGILFLPKGFRNGGWAFSSFSMFFSATLTFICILKLIDLKKKVGGNYT